MPSADSSSLNSLYVAVNILAVMNSRARFLVSGRVQGVCYRMAARDEAKRLGLTGSVRNLADGGVEVVAEGEEKDLVLLHRWCQSGPPMARVLEVQADYLDATGEFDAFTIIHSGYGLR